MQFKYLRWHLLIRLTRCLQPSLWSDKKHGSHKRLAEPAALIYHVYFSNSPCSSCWPDNPCRQPPTSHNDSKGSDGWGSARHVSGYDTPVNQTEIPQHASQRASGPGPLPKGPVDVFYLSRSSPFHLNKQTLRVNSQRLGLLFTAAQGETIKTLSKPFPRVTNTTLCSF